MIYFVLENFKIFTKLRLYKSTYGMTSRRLNLHLESRGSLRDKNFGEFRSKTTFTFCENHKKLSNLPLSPHSILQNWVDYLKVTSLRDNPYPKMLTNQSGRPCPVGHGLWLIVVLGNPRTKTHTYFQRDHFYGGIEGRGEFTVKVKLGFDCQGWKWNYSEGENLRIFFRNLPGHWITCKWPPRQMKNWSSLSGFTWNPSS